MLMSGRQFGRWTVVADGVAKDWWLCRCICGNQREVRGAELRRGNSKSCGCGRRRHGHRPQGSPSPTYNSWQAMLGRCLNPSNASYDSHGGRGIEVCGRWKVFENFLQDMGNRPDSREIDRIDNDGNYGPENCRWATKKEQSRNRRSNTLITFKGITLVLTEWSERTGLKSTTISERLKRGWSIERALTEAVR